MRDHKMTMAMAQSIPGWEELVRSLNKIASIFSLPLSSTSSNMAFDRKWELETDVCVWLSLIPLITGGELCEKGGNESEISPVFGFRIWRLTFPASTFRLLSFRFQITFVHTFLPSLRLIHDTRIRYAASRGDHSRMPGKGIMAGNEELAFFSGVMVMKFAQRAQSRSFFVSFFCLARYETN